MKNKLAKAIDECIARVNSGEPVEACLDEYAAMRPQIEPLLRAALVISKAPKAAPSAEFRKTYKGRLMARLSQEAVRPAAEKHGHRASLLHGLTVAWQEFCQTLSGARRIAVPVTLALMLVFMVAYGASDFMSPSPALASQCTLSMVGGDTEVLATGDDEWQPGMEGMPLDKGMRVRTAPESQALLTFFEGTTIALEPGTDVEIKQVECGSDQAITIVIKQWFGKTISRVVKMIDPGSHYEIQTPSAVAIVRGTQFVTTVDAAGSTTVNTTEGLVSVVAQGEEVYVPIGQQTTVENGKAPSEPAPSANSGGRDAAPGQNKDDAVSYTHLRAHET